MDRRPHGQHVQRTRDRGLCRRKSIAKPRIRRQGVGRNQANPRSECRRNHRTSQHRLVRKEQTRNHSHERYRNPKPRRSLHGTRHPLLRLRHRLYLCLRREACRGIRSWFHGGRRTQLLRIVLQRNQGIHGAHAQALPQLLDSPRAHANLGRSYPSQFRHQNCQVRTRRQHSQLDDHPLRNAPCVSGYGQKGFDRRLQLHQPRCHFPQRGSRLVHEVH
mmetsp:Transcript_12941/g.27218  ORF Transcript_12941/g.27218 Transcript_12941/m.27218 type:complete len:218 (+) Transcript_12941:183-836(+)